LHNQSLAESFTSKPTVITYGDNVSYQINVTTSDSIGTIAIQGSNDYSPNTPDDPVTNAGNWASLNLSGTPQIDAANDTILLNLNQVPYKALRLVYTADTAGTGTCDIYVGFKDLA
jgi:hypothetical protein